MAFDEARRSRRFLLSRLSAQIDDLAASPFPGNHPGPQKWLALIRGIIDTGVEYLDKSEDSSLPPQRANDLIRDAAKLALSAYNCIRLFDGAGIDELPFPVVLPMQRWCEAAGLTNTMMFRAELVANYEIRPIKRDEFSYIRDPSKSLAKAIDDISWPLHRITVPSKALGILPHFAIVAHEIGHALFQKVTWDFSNFNADYSALEQRILSRLKISTLSLHLETYIKNVHINWLQEFASDAFGFLLAGPSFYFALSDILQTVGGSTLGMGASHPPSPLRRDLLFAQLCKSSDDFTSIFHKHTAITLTNDINSEILPALPDPDKLYKLLSSSLKPIENLPSEQQAAVQTEMISLFSAISDHIFTQARAYLDATSSFLVYTSSQYDDDLTSHLLPLCDTIPPIETGSTLTDRKSVNFASIINVGWVLLLTKLDSLAIKTASASNNTSERLEKLHALLLKGVELSEARRLWESVS